MRFKSLVLVSALSSLTFCTWSQDLQPASTIAISASDSQDQIREKAAHVVPTENQFSALKDEYIAFVHFGPNSFTGKEWGSGMENPEVFDLKNLDTDQWCEAMKAGGMTKVILTVKHHDGFVLWQTRYTDHGIMSTGFRDGKGDILRDLAKSCEKYGLKLGVYLSPADLYQIENHEGLYGNLSEKTERIIPRPVAGRPFANKTSFKFVVDDYNEYFLNQLFELLTEYGPIHEVWFDGAHPKTKGGQTYDYLAWKELIRTLAPEAVIFGRQDIRWGGNESGRTRKKEWNVIPYAEDPNQMNNFKDITGEDVASLEKLYQAKFLHYQPSEINTSIREGWFYRNDTEQGVRSADDVFDMYERSVGGNSVFLLNIPPNIDGLFGQRDTEALVEAGRRIKATYRKSLLATASGSKEVLDQNDETYIEIDELGQELIFELEKSTKINRFMIQEAIRTHGERIAAYELLAEIDGQWKLVATGDNVGYKDIVRFPEVSTRKLKLVILESRWLPVAISEVGAFHYASRPPQLEIERSLEGLVKISPAKGDFGWKTYEQDIAGSLNQDLEIRYTLDGSEPNSQSIVYKSPFDWQHGDIRAAAFSKGEQGPVNSYKFGIVKKEWKVLQVSSELEGKEAGLAIDAKENSYWKSQEENAALSLDLGAEYEMTGFTYLPPAYDGEGMIEQGEFWISTDGNHWEKVQDFEFGNLINDPTERHHLFNSKIKARFIKIQATRIAGGHGHTTIAEIDVLID